MQCGGTAVRQLVDPAAGILSVRLVEASDPGSEDTMGKGLEAVVDHRGIVHSPPFITELSFSCLVVLVNDVAETGRVPVDGGARTAGKWQKPLACCVVKFGLVMDAVLIIRVAENSDDVPLHPAQRM